MKSILLGIAAAISCCYTFAQQDANWVFGDSAGLNFHDGIIESFTSSMHGYEANASISDSDGNLLFYTNGINIWNKYHELMSNGDSLQIGGLPYGVEYGSSITQGVNIVPKPDSNNQYYIFYIKDFGLAYSLVDMSDSTGIVLDKNIEIFDKSLTEKMQAVKHANGCDWWLVLRGWPDVLEGDSAFYFLTYLITASSIEGPFLQYYGEEYEFDEVAGAGQMKFTRDGNKLALARNTFVDIYNFDRNSGLFSNWQSLSNVYDYPAYGLEWSPDGTKLYVSGNYGPASNTELIQYCINCNPDIESTKTLIYKENLSDYLLGQLQLGSDNKIYVCTSYKSSPPTTLFGIPNTNLSVINSPNSSGLTCDFDTLSISLNGNGIILGLPNMPNYNLGALPGYECDSIIISATDLKNENAIQIYPNPANEYIIISGDINANDLLKIYSADGRVVLQEKINTTNTKVDISMLPPGVYVLQINEDRRVKYSEKLFK
ncbi:MAG: T9SS type A sorting domain-containing protein [Bacteroidetes bacterium]|nr:T9SS type A sorting domain-containing protein [Bacteroidota bacterium]MBP7399175.1 T9SS type A sorting domain-containing protein [Chitinophagales bacterium]MBK7109630.1 T9SS type A sorting domain-containing protein [Bacteroidota bacterium]MBK8487639.1 T9SS type A sorting domain-containing protein [Bacteroidota bacterium]MBK8682619.1 T9SS type A sorting domain-containing protein [Bacteroidota bacterium]